MNKVILHFKNAEVIDVETKDDLKELSDRIYKSIDVLEIIRFEGPYGTVIANVEEIQCFEFMEE